MILPLFAFFIKRPFEEIQNTVLMICPHQMNTNGRIWELLHISKEKNGILHKTEPLNDFFIH